MKVLGVCDTAFAFLEMDVSEGGAEGLMCCDDVASGDAHIPYHCCHRFWYCLPRRWWLFSHLCFLWRFLSGVLEI